MKSFFALLLLVVITTFSSCCKQDDGEEITLSGNWHLMEYTPSAWFPDMKNYQKDDVVWRFDQSTLRVVVTQKAGVDFDLVPDGAFSYNQGDGVSSNTGDMLMIYDLTIDGVSLGAATINGNTMTITKQRTDGHLLNFKRY